jgi:hypothetical protein
VHILLRYKSFANLKILFNYSHKIVRDFFYDDSILGDLGQSESEDDDDELLESNESDHDLSEDVNDLTENANQTGDDEDNDAPPPDPTLLQLYQAANAPTTQVVLIDQNGNGTFAQFIALPLTGALAHFSDESD